MSRAPSARSGALRRECDHLVDRAGAGGKHEDSLDTERHAGAVRQACTERSQQALVDGDRPPTQAFPLAQIQLESAALLGGIGELVEAVAELDTVQIDLETLCDARSA